MPKSSLMITVVAGVLPDSRKKKGKRTPINLPTKKVGVLFCVCLVRRLYKKEKGHPLIYQPKKWVSFSVVP